MKPIIHILIAIPALMIFIEDLRSRMVTVWKIILLLVFSLAFFLITSANLKEQMQLALSNFGIITVIYFSLVAFYFLKEKKLSFALNKKIGLADLLLVFPPALCFSTIIFLYFILICIFCGIVFALLQKLFEKNSSITIPLAGISSLLFCVCLFLLNIFDISCADNAALFEKFMLP